ncbi:dormancy-associated protein homolog 3-like isoform X1 [Impatiens glandulifera]|uniref:dormancy-associated protein homolog 3-like isoform X1 n=1 Tax=Impatiens glandulifera TaxID=253017 RepID=UPI001FB07494|nr:dormancy-associated protein homolog 3-like isoform X1 [Impatiens glandulifera]
MSLLGQLWDDTLAGPLPETGLGKLRKRPTFSLRPAKESEDGNGGGNSNESVKVTRSIMIVRPPQMNNQDGSTPPSSPAASPAGSTPPVSPFAGGREAYRLLRRKSLSDAYEKANRIRSGNAGPPYDV